LAVQDFLRKLLFMPTILRAKILVLSDAAAAGRRRDESGPAVQELLERHGWQVSACSILPDDSEQIRQQLERWTAGDDCDAIFTTGGTGLGPRDVTPEVTRALAEREVPGLAELMRAEGMRKTRRAALAGIIDLLPHAVDLLQGRSEHSD
jgi:molybdenum cofactor synthesis domain-containing protein